MKIKIYICKLCKKQGKRFSGIRPEVRKHMREFHLIKSHKFRGNTEKHESIITPKIEVVNFEDELNNRRIKNV